MGSFGESRSLRRAAILPLPKPDRKQSCANQRHRERLRNYNGGAPRKNIPCISGTRPFYVCRKEIVVRGVVSYQACLRDAAEAGCTKHCEFERPRIRIRTA